MKTVYLLGCAKQKRDYKCQAKELYSKSNLFNLSLRYAQTKVTDAEIYILSALHYLIPLNKEINPYNESLNRMSKKQQDEWGLITVKEIEKLFCIMDTNFVFLAGKNYYNPLIPYLKNYEIPIPNNYSIGARLKWLKENTHERDTN